MFLESFPSNPQYQVEVVDENKDGKAELIVELMQKNQRGTGNQLMTIGYVLYKVSDAIYFKTV